MKLSYLSQDSSTCTRDSGLPNQLRRPNVQTYLVLLELHRRGRDQRVMKLETGASYVASRNLCQSNFPFCNLVITRRIQSFPVLPQLFRRPTSTQTWEPSAVADYNALNRLQVCP